MSDIEKYYAEYYKKMGDGAYTGEKARVSSRMLQTVDWIKQHVKPGGKILDLGCGDAVFSDMLPEYEWYGFDFNIEKASSRKISLIQGNLEVHPYPYDTASMDCIICEEVQEHAMIPEKINQEAKRILKRDGVYIVTTPQHTWIVNLLQGFQNLVYDPDLSWRVEHIHTFDFASHKKILTMHGFYIEDFIGLDGHYDGFVHPMAAKVQERLREQGVEVDVYRLHQWMGQGLPSMQHTIGLLCRKV